MDGEKNSAATPEFSASWAIIVNDRGKIINADEGWRKCDRASLPFFRYCPISGLPGDETLVLGGAALKEASEQWRNFISGMISATLGAGGEIQHEYSVKRGDEEHRFRVRANALDGIGGRCLVVVHRDITVRHRTEQALRGSDALFRRVIEETSDGIFMYDLEGRFVLTNAANAEVLGYSAEYLLGRTIEDVFTPEIARNIREQNQLVLTTGRPLDFELVFQGPRGDRTVLVRKSVYRDLEDHVVGLLGIARDITARKRVEDALARSERYFRALIENSADCVTLVDSAGNVRYADPSSKRMFGFEVRDLTGTNAFLWIHPDDRAAAMAMFDELKTLPGASMTVQYRSLCKDGRWQWTEATATNLLEDSTVGAFVLNQRDITERKNTEAALGRFEAIVESANDAIIGFDRTGTITSWNPAAERMFGYSEETALGKSLDILLPPDREHESAKALSAQARSRAISDLETMRVAKDGRRIEVSITISAIRDQERQIAGYCTIVHDITERRRLEQQILQVADFEKQRLGHELHDDLCQILVGISLLGNALHDELRALGVKQAADARQINQLALEAVERARNLAKGLSPLNLQGGGLMAAFETLATDTERIFRIPCAFECSAAISIENPTEANHLYRIVQEALHNAVKHSQAEKVAIVLESESEAICITVRDNGKGMPNGKHPTGEGSDPAVSSGLGMHTMQHRARIIGATLEFRRNPDAGTSVVCTLPARR